MRNILSMIGLVLLLVPALVVAQTPPPPDDSDPDICTDDPEVLAILALDPINASYMNEIKKRLNRFINLADGETASVNDFGTYLQNVTFAAAAMSTLLDTDRRLVETERNLKDRTLCLNIDLLILEAHVENVRCEMKEAYEAIEGSAILILTEALRFLDDRFKELTQGATDLSYIDNTWIFVLGYEQFDEEVHELELCPFHTDYLPPTAAGWGCDEEVLANYASDFISIELQRDAFITMIQKRDQFLTSIGFIPATIQKIAALLGRPPPDTSGFGSATTAPHLIRFGCNGSESPTTLHSDRIGRWPEGAARTALRGFFSITEMDHENILSELKQKRGEEGEQREQADYLKIVEEFPEGSQERQDAEDQEEDRSLGAVLNRGVRDEARLFFRKLSIHQGEREADIASKATDAEQQTIEAMKPVRAEVKFMSGLGQNLPSGLRGFTRNYAYWLRRSCLFRPCNASLDRILKIILEDSCFPYVSGAYLGDSEEHERQDTCREDAEL